LFTSVTIGVTPQEVLKDGDVTAFSAAWRGHTPITEFQLDLAGEPWAVAFRLVRRFDVRDYGRNVLRASTGSEHEQGGKCQPQKPGPK
jgi:hypothetical protein